MSMDLIQRLLLLELDGLTSTPHRLRAALASWQYDLEVHEVVDHLRSLEATNFVSGPGISRVHHLPVWLTTAGKQRLERLGHDFGTWRRVHVQ
jgi:hypothetical protein